MNESKIFLSKRLAEFEKKNVELEKLNYSLQNKVNLALSEKEQMKLEINNLKH
jgi:hypothetical protein